VTPRDGDRDERRQQHAKQDEWDDERQEQKQHRQQARDHGGRLRQQDPDAPDQPGDVARLVVLSLRCDHQRL
jgi:hypothetical protein